MSPRAVRCSEAGCSAFLRSFSWGAATRAAEAQLEEPADAIAMVALLRVGREAL